jgi:pimeloyl-ACP methyl ester carboxylesterase
MGSTVHTVKGGTGGSSIPPGLVTNATKGGFIVISLNTRSAAGFYVNSTCGGPQEQDVLDAIAHEQGLRNVGKVYLVGFSMGSIGALSIAAHHHSMIAGVAIGGPITDLFEQYAYTGGIATLNDDLCRVTPGPKATAVDRLFEYLSPARFAPTNFSGIPLYVTAGGEDTSAPNNFSLWPYAHANSTIVNSSCIAAKTLGEPAGCTTTFDALATSQPKNYSVRFVYEADGVHSADQLPGADVIAFFLGTVGAGLYVAAFPPSTVTAAPTPP